MTQRTLVAVSLDRKRPRQNGLLHRGIAQPACAARPGRHRVVSLDTDPAKATGAIRPARCRGRPDRRFAGRPPQPHGV